MSPTYTGEGGAHAAKLAKHAGGKARSSGGVLAVSKLGILIGAIGDAKIKSDNLIIEGASDQVMHGVVPGIVGVGVGEIAKAAAAVQLPAQYADGSNATVTLLDVFAAAVEDAQAALADDSGDGDGN